MNIDTYILSETIRQSGTVEEAAGMKDALINLRHNNYSVDSSNAEGIIRFIAMKINGERWYRETPVTFANGGFAVPPQQIEPAMENLFFLIGIVVEDERPAWTVDDAIKEFLLIHPFRDGNGRVASLLRNWLLGTLDNPTPLPYYFGEGPQ